MAGAEARGRLQPVMKMTEYPWYAPHQAWLAGDPAGRRAGLRGAGPTRADPGGGGGPGGRGREGRGPEGRGPEGRGPEGRGPEGRGPDARGPEGRGPEGQGFPPRGTEIRTGMLTVVAPTPVKAAAAAKHLVDLVGADLVIARLPMFFALNDPYLRAQGYPLALLPAAWNRLIVLTVPEPVGDEAERTLAYVRRLRGGR